MEGENKEGVGEMKRHSVDDKGVLKYLRKSHLGYYFGLLLVLILGVYIRTRNLGLLKSKYLLALDPHYFLRIAREILVTGGLKATDMMRYVPLGFENSKENIFLSYVWVWMYKIFNAVGIEITLEQTAIIYPVVFFALGIIVFYFLVKELFNNKVALLASLFLSVIPAYLYRTMAGFADKEALGIFFMYLTFLFYIKAQKSPRIWISVVYGLSAGIFTGFMGLSWGGFKFILVVIALYNAVLFVLGKIRKNDVYVYIAWAVPFTIILSLFIQKYGGFTGLLTSSTTGLSYIVLILLIVSIYMPKIKVIEKIKLPKPISILIVLVLLLVVLSPLGLITAKVIGVNIVEGVSFVGLAKDVKGLMLSGLAQNRVGLTVAENKQPYFTDWYNTFRVYFFLFFIGAGVLFYTLVKPLGKDAKKLTTLFFLFMIGFIFSRYASGSVLNGENFISQLVYLGSLGVFGLLMLIYFLRVHYKDKEKYNTILKLNRKIIFVLIWFAMMVIAARGGIRLFIMLAPITAVIAGFFIVKIWRYIVEIDDKIYRYASFLVIGFFVIAIIGLNASTSIAQATYTGPSYNQQWQKAMEWVKEGTAQDAVFAHWWDYGYWVQTNGKRATITDGGNVIAYWNHLMGRHVLSGRNSEEAFKFLKVHDATHMLIISDEIGKYTAYSSIGSDENFDIFSWINTFVMNPQITVKENNETVYYFQGYTPLDEAVVYNDKVFPQKESYIAGFKIPVIEDEELSEYEIKQPKAITIHNQRKEEIPVECVFIDGEKKLFEEKGLKGCVRIIPRYLNNQYQQENGALLWVSRKGVEALWTRLFLFDEKVEGFEIVYDDTNMNGLAYYNGRILGPLKIWKISYPDELDISDVEEKYLAKTTPEWMQLSGVVI